MNKNIRFLSSFRAGLLGSMIVMSSLSSYAEVKTYFSGWKNYPEASHILAAERAERLDVSDYLRWKRLTTSADVDINSVEALNFIRRNQGWYYWPNASLIKKRIEGSFSNETPAADIIRFYTNNIEPTSGRGWYYYLRALESQGKGEKFSSLVKGGWAKASFKKEIEAQFLSRYKGYLNQNDHIRRIDNLLYRGLASEARRMYAYIPNDWKKLAEARIALRYKGKDVEARLAAVPSSLANNKGLQYERIRWRQAKGLAKGALDLAFDAGKPNDWTRLWWNVQEKASRDAYDMKRYKTAQKIASSHGSDDGSSVILVEGEWLAGRAAYKVSGLENVALTHFQNLYEKANNPAWRAKGAYWAGRSMAKAGKNDIAQAWYQKAAVFSHHFYGQLSAAQAGLSVPQKIAELNALPLENGSAILALPTTGNNRLANIAEMLVKNGRSREARLFAVSACPSGSGANVIKSCALWAKSIGLPDAALSLAKRLDRLGSYTLMSELYPTISLPSVKNSAGYERLEKSLIHAIIRQESAFDHDVGSHAGAKGYMQLMPATAKETANKYGLGWSGTSRLFTKDYNITLGTHYLADQVKRYNGSYILAAVAYNAGPGRANQWIKRYGDPRSAKVDAIEWVEEIPIEETRNYVQHILENLLVYRSIFDDADKNETLSSIMQHGGIPKRFR
ncbi:MAG: transglycosylase SLT domain-containing protein [Alphaproteobacteria bacterium]